MTWRWWGILLVAAIYFFLGHFLIDGTDKSFENLIKNAGFSYQCYGFILAIIGQRVFAKRYGVPTIPESLISMIKKLTSDSKETMCVVTNSIGMALGVNPPTSSVSTKSLDIEKRVQVLEINMKFLRSDIDSVKTEIIDEFNRENKRYDARISAIENLIEDVGESLKSDRYDQVSDGRMAVVVFFIGSAMTTFAQELVPLFRWII